MKSVLKYSGASCYIFIHISRGRFIFEIQFLDKDGPLSLDIIKSNRTFPLKKHLWQHAFSIKGISD